jgi:hypothetical protein
MDNSLTKKKHAIRPMEFWYNTAVFETWKDTDAHHREATSKRPKHHWLATSNQIRHSGREYGANQEHKIDASMITSH